MKNNLKEFKKLWKYIKEDKSKAVVASLMIIISSIAGVTYGYLAGEALQAITDMNLKMSIIYLLIYLAISVICSNFIYEKGIYLFSKLEIKLTSKISKEAYQKCLDLPASAFEVKTSGEIINRITSDAEVLSNTFSHLLTMLVEIFSSMIITIYVFYNSWIVGVFILLMIIIIALITKHFSPKHKRNNENIKNSNDEFTSNVTETIRGIREIKTLGIKSNMMENTIKLIKKLQENKVEQVKDFRNNVIIADIFRSLTEVGTFTLCSVLVYFRIIDLAFYIAMTYYVYRFTWITKNITDINKTYQRVLVSITRINEILDNRLFQDEEFGNIDLTTCFGKIELKNVDFSYGKDEKVLDNTSVKFEPHKKIALVGKSGQGKSTIFNLLTKIYNPNSGNIYIDGIELQDISETSLRNHVSIIRQDPYIFNRTIKENFKMVNPKISLKEIRKYAKLSYLDDYIMSLPKKYDTLLGEGGTNLSGGQKQRLAIARALAKKSKILLLDEATSALDNESQLYIQKTIDELVKDHTIIIVAHRLSTIIDSDIIYVIDKGKIVDSGSHQELIEKSETYKSLYVNEFN